jgi:uncharacterized membrane protein
MPSGNNPSTPAAEDQRLLPVQSRTSFLAQTGLIAAVYATLTLIVIQFMGYLSWSLVQLRLSEALTVLPLFFPAAVPGLTLGCFIANLFNMGATGPLGWFDVVFGPLATLMGAFWTYRFRATPKRAMLGPIIFNALIVPAYLPVILRGLGLYAIPFTSIHLEGSFIAMYLFGVVCVGVGQAAVVYGIGMPLTTVLRRVLASSAMKGSS